VLIMNFQFFDPTTGSSTQSLGQTSGGIDSCVGHGGILSLGGHLGAARSLLSSPSTI